MTGTLAVAIHDVGPRSYRRVLAIRAWLEEHGVDRVTLLVIPAPELHPIGARAPALVDWLHGRTAQGDVVAQHGLAHRAAFRPRWPGGVLAAFQGLTALPFHWSADLGGVNIKDHGRIRSRALCLGTSTPLKRALSPTVVRAAARSDTELMRLDVHPADFDLPGHVATLESVLELAAGRCTVTYDELGA